MDVERIQKINNLALELMKQGLAENREDAVSQAEKIFRNQDTGGYDCIKDSVVVEEPKKDTQEASVQESLGHDKVKQILQQNTQFIVTKFKEFQEKISKMENEIESLKSHIRSHRVPTVSEILAQKKENEEKQVEEQTNANNQNTEQAPSHPRSGNYKDEDVSIEKFFYMGSK